jgi:hypothetical protein
VNIRMVKSVAFCLALALTLSSTTLSSTVRAERPSAPDLLPEETLAFVRIANIKEAYEKFQETSAAKIFKDPELKPLIDQLYGEGLKAFQVVEDELGLSLNDLLSIPQGELCVALLDQASTPPQLVAFLDVGDSMDNLNKLIDRAIQETGEGANFATNNYREHELLTISGQGRRNQSLVMVRSESTVMITSKDTTMKQMLDAWDDRDEERTKLIDNEKFTTVMKRCVGTKEERPQMTFFIDPIRIVRAVTRGNAGAAIALTMLNPLGLDNLEAVGGSVILATEEFDSIAHFHLMIKQPREAILKMIALRKVDTTPEPWVSGDASSYMTLQWAPEQTFDELAKIYDLIRLDEGAFRELARAQVSERIGMDLEEDLLKGLSGRVTMFTQVQRPVKVNSQVTGILVHFDDEGTASDIVEKVVNKFPNLFEAKSYGSNRYYGIEQGNNRRRQQANLDSEFFRTPTPSMCQLGNCILLTDSEGLIEDCFKTKADPGRSLAEDLEYQLVISRLSRQPGGNNPSMIAFSRPEEQFRLWYEIATADSSKTRLTAAAENNPFFRTLDSALVENPLPPFATIAKYLAPAGGIVTDEATGIHYIAFGMRRE